jgi:hypothetical protein
MSLQRTEDEEEFWLSLWLRRSIQLPGRTIDTSKARHFDFDYIFEPPVPDPIFKPIPIPKDYIPLWQAWFIYAAITAGLPLGHETAGAALGAAVAKRMGVSAVIGGGVGYLAAIIIGGSVATILDPGDLYEGGLDVQLYSPGNPFGVVPPGVVFTQPVHRGRLNPIYLAGGYRFVS